MRVLIGVLVGTGAIGSLRLRAARVFVEGGGRALHPVLVVLAQLFERDFGRPRGPRFKKRRGSPGGVPEIFDHIDEAHV